MEREAIVECRICGCPIHEDQEGYEENLCNGCLQTMLDEQTDGQIDDEILKKYEKQKEPTQK